MNLKMYNIYLLSIEKGVVPFMMGLFVKVTVLLTGLSSCSNMTSELTSGNGLITVLGMYNVTCGPISGQ